MLRQLPSIRARKECESLHNVLRTFSGKFNWIQRSGLFVLHSSPLRASQAFAGFYSNKLNQNSQGLCSLLRQHQLLKGIPRCSTETVLQTDAALAGGTVLYLCMPCPVTGRPIRCSSLPAPPHTHTHHPSLPTLFSLWPHSVIFVFLLPHSQVFYKVSPCITHLTMH